MKYHGKAMNKKENIEEIKRKFEKSPNDIQIFNELISYYIKSDSKNDLEEALALVNEKKEVFKDEAEYYKIVAHLYLRMEHVPRARDFAIDSGNKAILLDRENPKRYLNLGYIYWWYGEVEKAITITEEGLRLGERIKNEEIINLTKGNLAFFYAQLGIDKEEAIRFAEEAYQNDKSASTIDTLGYVKMKFASSKKDLEEAERLFLEARTREDANLKEIERHLSELATERKKKYD